MIQVTHLRLANLEPCHQVTMNHAKGLVVGLTLPTNVSNHIVAIRAVTRCNVLPLRRLAGRRMSGTVAIGTALDALSEGQNVGQGLDRLDAAHISTFQDAATRRTPLQFTGIHDGRLVA